MTLMEVVMRKTADLKPYPQNPRINDQAVDAVAESIKQFGFRQPIVVDAENIVIVGHTRLKAAVKLGIEEVPVHVADLPPEKARAYRIADNATAARSDWDHELLPLELRALEELNIDLAVLALPDNISLRFDIEEASGHALSNTPKSPFRQVTFTVHDDQWEIVAAAISRAKAAGGAESELNENSNGNALCHIAQCFLEAKCGTC